MTGKTSGAASAPPAKPEEFRLVQDISVKLSVEIDQMKMSVQKLSDLTADCILASTKPAGHPVEICVNGCQIARGEIVPLGSMAGVKITEILRPGSRKPGTRT